VLTAHNAREPSTRDTKLPHETATKIKYLRRAAETHSHWKLHRETVESVLLEIETKRHDFVHGAAIKQRGNERHWL
jgi:hypothetical protein